MNLKEIKRRLKNLTPIEIFILITIIFFTIFIVKFFGRKKEFITVKVEVVKQNWLNNYDPYGYRTPFWISDKVKIGQTEKNNSGQIIATLVDLENYEYENEEAELYLTLKLEVIFDKKTGIYYFKDKPLNIGSIIELNLNNIELKGQIIDNNVPQNGYPTKYFITTVRARNLNSWAYEKIVPGLKIYNRATNEVVGEITKVNLENSSLQEIKTDSTGRYLTTINSDKNKDAVITMKIKGYQIDNKWFFTGQQNLKVNNFLFIYTDQINLKYSEIQNIEETNYF